MSTSVPIAHPITEFRTARALIGHHLRARDGVIGEVKDLYFDDHHWRLRYFVVEAGAWLKRRRVLIAPEAVHAPAWNKNERVLPVDLSQQQVRESPPVDTDRPVSRQSEAALREYYGWPVYWALGYPVPGFAAAPPIVDRVASAPARADRAHNDSHLRSVNDTIHYRLRGTDGEIGHVGDFLVDDHSWSIRYIVADSGKWLPGRKVLISPWWISEISWADAVVAVDLTMAEIKNSPPYDPSRPFTMEDVERLHDHYRRPRHVGWRPGEPRMTIESAAFESGGDIPLRYSQYGENRQPPLSFHGVPPDAVTLALIVDDPDAPKGTFTHWIAFNLDPKTRALPENAAMGDAQEGLNDSGHTSYAGPLPPNGEHRYFFRLYALDGVLDLPNGADRDSVLHAMEGHIIADAVWMGRFATPVQAKRDGA